MAKKQKFYVVWVGKETGVFSSWDKCKEQIANFPNAKYKSFSTQEEAKEAYQSSADSYIYHKTSKEKTKRETHRPQIHALAVDAACSGNPGLMEYRGVMIDTGEQIFHLGPLEQGTNNIGEFLAIVHGLALMKKQSVSLPIYSDSVNAINWIKAKKCRTKLKETPKNKPIFELIERAETWLASNEITTPIIKWETSQWGEIPADFGRK